MRYKQWLFWQRNLEDNFSLLMFPVLLGSCFNVSRSWSWELWLPPGALQGFLPPSAYLLMLKSLSSSPAQLLSFLSFLYSFFFLISFAFPSLSEHTFFSYVIPVLPAHPCSMPPFQLHPCPLSFPLFPSPSPSLRFSLVSDHLHAPFLTLLAVSLPLWPLPLLLHINLPHTVVLRVISPFPIHLFLIAYALVTSFAMVFNVAKELSVSFTSSIPVSFQPFCLLSSLVCPWSILTLDHNCLLTFQPKWFARNRKGRKNVKHWEIWIGDGISLDITEIAISLE